MNNDIKEILDKLLKYFKESNVNDFGYEQDKLISYEEAQILLDYITNLQEENDRHFKEAIRYENACDELEIRIDKAIEYCKILYTDNTSMNSQKEIAFRAKEIINILQGEDKDE